MSIAWFRAPSFRQGLPELWIHRPPWLRSSPMCFRSRRWFSADCRLCLLKQIQYRVESTQGCASRYRDRSVEKRLAPKLWIRRCMPTRWWWTLLGFLRKIPSAATLFRHLSRYPAPYAGCKYLHQPVHTLGMKSPYLPPWRSSIRRALPLSADS